jgi:hypothetical protein
MSQTYKVEPVRHMSGAVVGYNVIHRSTRDVIARFNNRNYADRCCQIENRESNS